MYKGDKNQSSGEEDSIPQNTFLHFFEMIRSINVINQADASIYNYQKEKDI